VDVGIGDTHPQRFQRRLVLAYRHLGLFLLLRRLVPLPVEVGAARRHQLRLGFGLLPGVFRLVAGDVFVGKESGQAFGVSFEVGGLGLGLVELGLGLVDG
jgi:hypothetical protein